MRLIRGCRSTKKLLSGAGNLGVFQGPYGFWISIFLAFQIGVLMSSTKITVRNDGPLRIEGAVELVDMEGKPYGLGGREAFALCRCGHSANKPFCDGAHKNAGFQDKQQARDLPPPLPKA
jgi:CDGSH-type Zn-finger protein